MTGHPKIHLSRLRAIGWSHWDPIGLRGVEGGIDDEYDTYLLKAAGMIHRGETDAAAVEYLVWAENEHMGLGVRDDTRNRARATINAMRADEQLWTEP